MSKNLALRFFNVYLKGYDKNLYNEEYADSLCKTNRIVIDIAWEDKLKRPFISIEKPLVGYLYIFDKRIAPIRNTIIIGKIVVEINAYDGIEKVGFYVDDELKFIDDIPPYQWLWGEMSMGRHKIKIIAYGMEGTVEKEIEVIKIL